MATVVNCWFRVLLAGLLTTVMQAPALAGPVELIYIGTWTTAPGSGNTPSPPGPGMATGQRYVTKITYDDSSTVSTANILTEGFAPSGQQMSTIKLTDPGNSLDIFVPMEGLDGGTPYVYTQNETDHFPAFTPAPTLNFTLGSDISNEGNVIGLEFEGDFVLGSEFNILEMYNTAANSTAEINQLSQVLQCTDALCTGSAIAIRGVNALAEAVDVVADAGADIVYSAATLSATTASSSTDNDLGAGRSDGEDFINASWTEGGLTLTGTATGNDIMVALQNSGLTNTVDTATWQVELSEQLTGLSDTDTLIASYANSDPILTATSVVQASGIDFAQMITDADLAINALIADFEILTETAWLGVIDVSAFFAELFSTDSQSSTYAELEAAFGLGMHAIDFSVTDLAGAMSTVSLSFDVLDTGPSDVPAPGTLLLVLLGLAGVRAARAAPKTVGC